MNLLTRLEDWPYIILPIIIVLSFLLLGWLVEQRVVSQLLSIAREKNPVSYTHLTLPTNREV